MVLNKAHPSAMKRPVGRKLAEHFVWGQCLAVDTHKCTYLDTRHTLTDTHTDFAVPPL